MHFFFFQQKKLFCYDANAITCGFQRSITLPSSVIRAHTIRNLRNPGKEAGMILKYYGHSPNASLRHPSTARWIQERRDRKELSHKRLQKQFTSRSTKHTFCSLLWERICYASCSILVLFRTLQNIGRVFYSNRLVTCISECCG